jgi:transposase
MKKVTNLGRKVQCQDGDVVLNKASRVVGIDIGKQELSCVMMDVNETIVCRFTVEGTLSGYKAMLDRVKLAMRGRGKVVFALEPTGHYWMVLGQFFEDHNQAYVLIHPLVVARSREVERLNKGKTDPFDASLIARLACRGEVIRTQVPGDYWAKIRFFAREYMDREKDSAREKNRISSYLETALPGLFEIFPDPLTTTGRACLRALANFKEAITEGFGSFESRIRTHFKGKRLLISRARGLYEMLRYDNVLGLRSGRDAMFFRIINALDRLELYERHKDAAEQSLLALYNQSEFKKYLDSIWGTTSTVNALALAFIGDPTCYDSPKALVKLAGSDPVLNESGKFKGRTSISHRGRSLLRKAGDRIAFLLEKRNAIFRAFLHRLMTRPKNRLTKRQARVACINKYFRTVWVLCNHRIPFNPALA